MTASSSPKVAAKKAPKRLEAFESNSFIYLGVILVVGFILAFVLHMPAPGQDLKQGTKGTISGKTEDGKRLTIPLTLDMLKEEYQYNSSITNFTGLALVNFPSERKSIILPAERFANTMTMSTDTIATLQGTVMVNDDVRTNASVPIFYTDLKQLVPGTPGTVQLTFVKNNKTAIVPYEGRKTNAGAISASIPGPAMNAFLWVLEIGLYAALAWYITRHPIVATVALALGVVMRYVFVFIYVGAFGAMDGTGFLATLIKNEQQWINQLLNMAVVGGLFALPLRNFLKTGFNYKINMDLDADVVKPSAQQVPANKFSFAPKQTQVADIKIRKAPKPTASAEQGMLTPPEDFVRPEPVKGVHGTVTVPRKVIIASVPEAESIMRSDKPIPVQLSLIVPQLKRATVWLTWQQIFDTGNTDPSLGNPHMDDPELYDRWVRIPAKYYALQVPEQFYAKGHMNHPAWMQQPHVPQEEQFDLEQEHV